MKRSRGRERKREAFVKPGSNGGIINIEQAYTLMCNITLNKIECRRCSCCFRFFFFCRLFVHSFIDSFILFIFSFFYFIVFTVAAILLLLLLLLLLMLFLQICLRYVLSVYCVCITERMFFLFFFRSFIFFTINSRPFGTISGIYISLLDRVKVYKP